MQHGHRIDAREYGSYGRSHSLPYETRRNEDGDDLMAKPTHDRRTYLERREYKLSYSKAHRGMTRRAIQRSTWKSKGFDLAKAEEKYSAAFCCEICGIEFTGEVQKHLDHIHGTNPIRGVLCGNCNLAIGLFHDDPSRIQTAIRYLETKRL